MEHDEALRLFEGMAEQDQIEFIKQALIEKVSKADCWQSCDLTAIYRILRLIGRHRDPVS